MPLRLREGERECLEKLVQNAKDARILKRARALLDLDAGDRPETVARRYGVTRSTIYNWIKRYRTRGLSDAALRDLPRPGRPRSARESFDKNRHRPGD